jgi:hypothetical protein
MGLFLLEAGAGTALLLLFFPTKTLGPGFFSLHGALAVLFVGLSALTRPQGLGTPPAAAAALLALYAALARAGKAAAATASRGRRRRLPCPAWSVMMAAPGRAAMRGRLSALSWAGSSSGRSF